jgi:hypothetical protein
MRQSIVTAGGTDSAGGKAISANEAREIFDYAKALGVSVPQLTEQMNMWVNSSPTAQGSYSDADIAKAIKEYFPQEASGFFGLHSGQNYAKGGLASLPESRGYYLGGPTDGMADKVPATIDGRQEARLSDGEFVIPADVTSHLGNGNSEAGAKVLYDMMDRVRRARTGRAEQGRQINPNKYTPA